MHGIMYFADENTARTALDRFEHPETYPPVARAAIFELVRDIRDFALAHGSLRVAGATVVFDGSAPFEIPESPSPTRIFRGLAR